MAALDQARVALFRAMESERSLSRCTYLYSARDALNAAGFPRWADLAESAALRIGGDDSDIRELLFELDCECSRRSHAMQKAAAQCCVLTAFLALATPGYAACGLLPSGGSLTPGQSITSCNGTYTLAFQGDGNVVLYEGAGTISANPLWSTGTYGKSSAILTMQGDGNLVLYKPGATAAVNALWASSELGGLFGEPGELAVQDDGNLVVYATVDNGVLWTSRTYTPVATPIDASYKLTFDEEFNGNSIDRTKWQVTFDGNPDLSYNTYYPACFYNSTNLKVAWGQVQLSVTPGAAPCNYHTAAITTNFLQEYGYWEARLKVPANAHGIGMHFWHDRSGWLFPEIDPFEWVGGWASGGPNCYSTSYNDINGNYGTPVHPCGIDQNWHVYGMLWTPTTITMYRDGVQNAQYPNYNTVGHGPMWTILGAGLSFIGDQPIDSSTVFPAILQVDYVHIYSNASGAVAVTPQANYGGPGYNR